MKYNRQETASRLRAWARAIYFARQSAERDLLHERLDLVETEMIRYAHAIELENEVSKENVPCQQ